MAISYKKLWKLLIDKNLKKTEMVQKSGITGNVLGRLSRNEPISMASMEKICIFLHCNIGDVMEFVYSEDMR